MSAEETRACNVCGEVKPIDAFPWVLVGGGKRSARCDACRAAGKRRDHRRNRPADPEPRVQRRFRQETGPGSAANRKRSPAAQRRLADLRHYGFVR